MTREALIVSTALGLLFLPVLWPRFSVGHERAFPLNGPAWSLFSELLANLVFAFVAPRLTRTVLGAILAVSALLLFATWLGLGDLDAGSSIAHFAAGPARVWWSFFAGVAVHRLWRARPSPRLPWWIYPPLLLAALACPIELFSVLVAFPALIYFAASADPKGLGAWACAQLGAISYGLYVIHKPIVEAIRREVGIEAPWGGLALALAIILASLALNYVLDQPVRRWLERMVLPHVRSGRKAKPQPV